MRCIRVRLRPTQCLFYRPLASAPFPLPIVHSEQLPSSDFRPTLPTRPFTSTNSRRSHIGSAPLTIPPSVTVVFTPPVPKPKPRSKLDAKHPDYFGHVDIKGPLGELRLSIPDFVKVNYDEESRKVVVSVQDRMIKHQKAMWGTTRAHLANYVRGVSEGHTTLLRLVGVGYRASIENSAATISPTFPGQKFLSLKLGYSHTIELAIPQGITATTPQPTRILLDGIEKVVVNEFAAKIRKWRVPEPYKGKGIFVNDETIKIKAKKIS